MNLIGLGYEILVLSLLNISVWKVKVMLNRLQYLVFHYCMKLSIGCIIDDTLLLKQQGYNLG